MSLRFGPVPQIAAGAVSAIHRACFPDDPWDVAAIEQVMKISGFFGRIGWIGSDPVGFALALALGEEAEILALGVVPGYRRSGAGTALLEAICAEAGRRGAERVCLEVSEDNTAARALYAAFGFTEVGRRRNYYLRAGCFVDALILRAQIITRVVAT